MRIRAKLLLSLLVGLVLVGAGAGCHDTDGDHTILDILIEDTELRIRNYSAVPLKIESRPIHPTLFSDHWETLDYLNSGESDRYWIRESRLRATYNGVEVETFTIYEADDTWVITGGP